MLAGLVEAVGACAPTERLAGSLVWAAARRARRLLHAELTYQHRVASGFDAAEPARPGDTSTWSCKRRSTPRSSPLPRPS
jgi:hypothetical protein